MVSREYQEFDKLEPQEWGAHQLQMNSFQADSGMHTGHTGSQSTAVG